MELLELLERRVSELLQNLHSLREENARLSASCEVITKMREENRLLTEELERERALRKEIDTRIDKLLAGISEYERESAPSGSDMPGSD